MGFESYAGQAIFGLAVHITHIPRANQQQLDAFFGINGNVTLFGGSRGRAFEISGCLYGQDIPTLLAGEAYLLSFADGIARTLTDPIGRIFYNVIFDGSYQPSADGPKWNSLGVILPYKCVFLGLT